MGGRMSLNKGKRAEREVIDLLQPIVDKTTYELNGPGIILQRNTIQADRGGSDIHGLEWLALEVKHHETMQVNEWWKQCRSQASRNQVPVLIYRCNHAPWLVKMYGGLGQDDVWVPSTVTVDVPAFLIWFRAKLEHELLKREDYFRS